MSVLVGGIVGWALVSTAIVLFEVWGHWRDGR